VAMADDVVDAAAAAAAVVVVVDVVVAAAENATAGATARPILESSAKSRPWLSQCENEDSIESDRMSTSSQPRALRTTQDCSALGLVPMLGQTHGGTEEYPGLAEHRRTSACQRYASSLSKAMAT